MNQDPDREIFIFLSIAVVMITLLLNWFFGLKVARTFMLVGGGFVIFVAVMHELSKLL